MPRDMLDCLQNSFESLSCEDIAKAERTLGVVFPQEYREFLLKHNGGWFKT